MAIFFSKKIRSQDYDYMEERDNKNIFIAFLLANESTFFPKINSVNGGHFLFLSL